MKCKQEPIQQQPASPLNRADSCAYQCVMKPTLPAGIIGLALYLAGLLFSPLSGAETDPPGKPYLQQLIKTASRKNLQADAYWHVLLHYEPGWFGWESEVDDPDFFLASHGKYDPHAELTATLAGFFQPVSFNSDKDHPQCRFPARFAWLGAQLDFQAGKLPSPDCQDLQTWLQEINAGSITLVFPYYYPDAPASIFGHTLLRINSSRSARPALLSYAVNYAALVDHEKTGPLEYGWKGVFGGFRGVFSISPYYLSVLSYNDIQQRDIWEYDLELTPEEIGRMMHHLWELKEIYFDYFFFRENCSYHLLSLLEVARLGLNLRSRHLFWTIPADTVRNITSTPGLLVRRTYRPSRWSSLKQQMADMSNTERQLVLSIIGSGTPAFTSQWLERTPESRSRVLEALISFYALQPTEESARLREWALSERAALKTILPPAEYPPETAPPETGHETVMTSISAGRTDGQTAYRGFSLRLALHGLLDATPGYIPNSALEFFHAGFRQYDEDKRVRLHQLTLANIVSVNSRSDIESGFSWKMNAGWRQPGQKRCPDCLLFEFNPGGGVGYSIPGGLFYTMGEFRYSNGADLDPGGHLSIGLTAGVLLKQIGFWKSMVETSFSSPSYSGRLPDLRQQAGVSYLRFKNHTLQLHCRRENSSVDCETGYRFYF